MAAAAVLDTSYLSTYCAIPEPTIHSLITEPTADLVTAFLRTVISKAREHDKLKAERLRVDVELENAIRSAELRARTLKANADKALQEVEELRVKLNEEETARASLTIQIHALQSDSSNSSVEVEALQAQVAKLEKSNRDALTLVDSKSTAQDKLAEELSLQHQKAVALRRENSNISERFQTVENSLSNAKLLESQLRGEIEQQKRNNEWLDSELKTKAAEHAKFRKEKNARIAELQRLNDDAASNIELLERNETTLRKRLEEVGNKAEEAFSKIQQLQEEAIRNEQSFRIELDTARRLADLQKQSADTARRRVQELEDSVEQIRDDAAEEISQAQAEIETERQAKDATERRVEQLETQLENLETSMQSGGRAGSPSLARPAINGLGGAGTPARAGSPAPFTPTSSRSRGGLSYTQMYTDYTAAKSELEAEKRRSEKLAQTLDDLIKEMEKKEPEIEESQLEHDRLESENAELSKLLADTREEKDAARKEAKRWHGTVAGARREAELLTQQLRDHGAQIKILLDEIQIRDAGVERSAAERLQLQQLAHGIAVDAVEETSDTARFISERLVPFKTIIDLQEKNSELLKIVRQLGEERESEEAKAKAHRQAQTEIELGSLRDRVERYKDEMKALVTQSQSYIRERDMFRRMLSHRGQLPADSDLESMFGSSVNATGSPRTPQPKRSVASVDNTPSAKDIADYARLLKELQSQFDAYRRETSTDYSTVREQAAALAKDKTQLQIEAARVSSQLTLSYERYQMLQANFDQMKAEGDEMRKRSQMLAEVAAKQDIRTQQVAEELIEAKSVTESLRHESANLKAERELWKKIETRLSEDNKALSEERSRLNKALTDSQNLSNERELADTESRRKLQGQVESLESRLQAANQKIEQEIDASRALNLRREYEVEQHRTRVDDLMKVLSSTKEELVNAKTLRDQLHARVEELKIDLRNAEDRVQALQPRPATDATNSDDPGQSENNASGLTTEQELGVEVADLKKELDLKQGELDEVRTQVEQYRKISQSSEEELQNLNDAYDQYRGEMDRELAEKIGQIKDLERRVEDISSELSLSNEQLSTVRSNADQAAIKLEQQRVQLQEQITRIKEEAESYKETAAFHEEDLKAQAEIAQQAQKNYENELVKHGEARKALQVARQDLNSVKLEVTQHKADADAARTTMSQSEESWQSTKERYEGEITELKSRHDEVLAQNKLLHQQLESFSSQIAALQHKRDAASKEPEMQDGYGGGADKLQEIINFLRREKEIVDVQYELTVQESKRTRQQLEYTQSQLEDTRLKLDQERLRQTEREQSSINHSKLMDTINELNVFRESSVTLRSEARQAQAQLSEKSKEVEVLVSQIEPLKSSLQQMANERETSQGELKLLEEDRDRWQQRAHNILQKYDRIDPAELEGLREKLSNLEGARDENDTQIAALQAQVVSQEEARKELRNRLGEQFKARSRELSEKIKEANSQSNTLKEQLDGVRADLETTTKARDEAVARVESLSLEVTQLRTALDQLREKNRAVDNEEEGQVEEGEVATQNGQKIDLEHRLKAEEAKAAEALQSEATAKRELRSIQTTADELQQQVRDLEAKASSLADELSRIRSQSGSSMQHTSDDNLEQIKQDLVVARKEIDAMRQDALQRVPKENDVGGEGESTVVPAEAEEAVAKIRAELDAIHSQRMRELDDNYKKRIESAKQQLSAKLNESRSTIKNFEEKMQALRQEHDVAEKNLKLAHESLVARMKTEHAQELDRLRKATSQEPAALSSDQQQTSQASVASTSPAVKEEASLPLAETQLSLQQVRSLVQNNAMVQEIMKRNIRDKIEQETTKLKGQWEIETTAKLDASRVENDKTLAQAVEKVNVESAKALADQLEEAKQRADKSKEQAVVMESKKWTAKISMAEGRSRTALVKIEFVSKAAAETPQRPVSEVWAIAKDLKAPPAQPAIAVPASATAAAGTTAAQSSQASQSPSARKPSTTIPGSAPGTGPGTMPTSTPSTAANASTPTAQSQQQQSTQTPRSTTVPATSQGATGGPSGATQTDTAPAQPASLPPKPQHTNQPAATGPAALRGGAGQGSGIPRGGPNNRGLGRGGRGGGNEQGHVAPGFPQGQQQHGQTPGQGHAQRPEQASSQRGEYSSNIPRGGGRGRGRVPAPAGNAALPPTSSPGGGPGFMNPQANHFQPGNKRPREEGAAGGDEGAGKRARGGAGAS